MIKNAIKTNAITRDEATAAKSVPVMDYYRSSLNS